MFGVNKGCSQNLLLQSSIPITNIEDIIPAKTGVVIRGNAGYYTFTPAESAATTDVTNNLMRGYAGVFEYEEVARPTDGSTNYVLAVEDGVAAFYRKDEAFYVSNNKAYLNVPAATAQSISLRFEGSTEIETSTLNPQPSTEVYDLMGRRVLNPTKGMYIVNGRKVVIK